MEYFLSSSQHLVLEEKKLTQTEYNNKWMEYFAL